MPDVDRRSAMKRPAIVEFVVNRETLDQVLECDLSLIRNKSPGLALSQPTFQGLARCRFVFSRGAFANLATVVVKGNPVNAATEENPSQAAHVLFHFFPLRFVFCGSRK